MEEELTFYHFLNKSQFDIFSNNIQYFKKFVSIINTIANINFYWIGIVIPHTSTILVPMSA